MDGYLAGHSNVNVSFFLEKDPTLITMKQTNYGETALHAAALKGHLDVCKLLIKKEPNLITQNR